MSQQRENNEQAKADRKTIIMIYSVVAIICAIIITCFMWLGDKSRNAAENVAAKGERKAVDVQYLSMEESIGLNDIVKLEKDFVATNQDGVEVNFQSLKGKVWVFAQFYGSCPECNKVNFEILKDVYSKYKSNPHFQLVTISVMEEEDGVKAMKNMADLLKVDTARWWFLTADVAEVNKFCSDNMLYAKFVDNTDPDASGMKGAIFHDMGLSVFNGDMIMKAKVDIYSQLQVKNEVGAGLKKEQLDLEIAAALEALEANQ